MTGRLIKYKGKKYQIGELAKMFDLNATTLAMRLYKYKWSLGKCLTKPPKPQRKALNYNEGIELYHFVMRRFYTKHQRLESYKRLIAEIKEQRMKKAA